MRARRRAPPEDVLDTLARMRIVEGIERLPLPEGPSVVTVGFFDGVHLGHRAVFARTVEAARERGVRSVAVTFDRHPREVLTPGSEPRLLTTVERRASLIEATGIDELRGAVVHEGVLADPRGGLRRARPRGRRARGACGDGEELHVRASRGGHDRQPARSWGRRSGSPRRAWSSSTWTARRVSSSSIRDALAAGDLEWPRIALGRRFVLDGEVVSGHGRGKGLGFPTANLQTWPRLLLPGQGIYAGVAELAGRRYPGRDRRGHQPDVRNRAAARGGVPARLRGRRPARRTARARVLGAPPRRGALRHRRRAGGGDRRRCRTDPAARPRGGGPASERPPRAQAAHAVLGADRCDRAGRGRDDGGVGHGRRPAGSGRIGRRSPGGAEQDDRVAVAPRPALPPSRRAGS